MSPRTTRSQQSILQLLQQMERAISAQDLYVELRNRDRTIGLATVYRGLGIKMTNADLAEQPYKA